jgi:hypothetical protein
MERLSEEYIERREEQPEPIKPTTPPVSNLMQQDRQEQLNYNRGCWLRTHGFELNDASVRSHAGLR